MNKRIFAASSIKAFSLSLFFLLIPACSQQPTYPEAPREGGNIVIDVSKLPSEVPEFFAHRYQGKNINFFVVKTNNTFLSFFDACIRCYTKRKGYRFEGEYVICRACNTKYPVSEIGKGFGNCYPIRLSGYIRDGKYYIPVALLEQQVDKF